jgi:hypothetical protein
MAKKYSAIQKKRYLLNHLGIMTIENIANELDCSEEWIYKMLKGIRKERDLIHCELVKTSAEEQFNRLNNNAKLAFTELMKERQKIMQGGDDNKLYKYNRMYIEAETALTKFLKAIGLYQPDLTIHTGPQQAIQVVFEGMYKPLPKPPKKKEKQVN